MPSVRKPDQNRGDAAFIFAIILGLALGIAIKKIKVGIIIGIALGIFVVFTGWMRSNKKE
jgi:hypothetical protein